MNNYGKGKLLPEHRRNIISLDLKALIIQDIEELCPNKTLRYGILTKVAVKYKLQRHTVAAIWNKYLVSGCITPARKGNIKGRKVVTEADIDFIQFLKTENPSMLTKTVKENLYQFSTVDQISDSTISRIVRDDLNMTFKRLTDFAPNRFTDQNILYTQAYLDYMYQKDPSKIKYMDESGAKQIDANAKYGHATKGYKAVSVNKFMDKPNCTLSLLIGLDGVCFSKVINGASNTGEYLQYFAEATEAYTELGTPAISPGDIIVVDNASIHRHEAEVLLYNFYMQMGVEYIFLPTYSPDFNPAELAFSKIKKLLKRPEFHDIVAEDLKVAVLMAVSHITSNDCYGYFKCTNSLNM